MPPNNKWFYSFSPFSLLLFSIFAQCAHASDLDALDQCILEVSRSAASDTPVGDILATCNAAKETSEVEPETGKANTHESALERRLAIEEATGIVPFTLTPHRPNYIIAAYNFLDYSEKVFEQEFSENRDFRNSEIQFQISYKLSIVRNLFNRQNAIFFAYTNRSFWQLFDEEDSRPFRETNHEPEAWLALKTDWRLFGLQNKLINLGVSHQSNGQGGLLSRSWNRLYATFIFEKNNFYFGIKPWYRLPESKKDDDNPDIEDYLGYFEFQGIYKHNKNSFGLFFRNNLRRSNRGAARLEWSVPIHNNVRTYVQWFYGYGESLIDYDNKVNTIGFGIQLTDWL